MLLVGAVGPHTTLALVHPSSSVDKMWPCLTSFASELSQNSVQACHPFPSRL